MSALTHLFAKAADGAGGGVLPELTLAEKPLSLAERDMMAAGRDGYYELLNVGRCWGAAMQVSKSERGESRSPVGRSTWVTMSRGYRSL